MKSDVFLDAILSLPRLSASSISRDGRWVAWTWFGVGPGADVFAAPVDGSSRPIRLTETDEDTILRAWIPDGSGVIVGQDTGGDEREQLFLVRLDRPGVMEPLTDPHPDYFIHGGEMTPDRRFLVYGMNYDVEAEKEIEATWIYRQDTHTGERTVLARPQRASFHNPEINDAGTAVLYGRQDLHPWGVQVWLVDIDGHNDREIVNMGADRSVQYSWFPDSRHVVVLAETETHRVLSTYDTMSGELHTLIDDPSRNIELAFAPRGLDRPGIVVAEVREARLRATLLDVETGEERAFPDLPGNLLPRRPVGDGQWAGTYYRSTHPADLVRFSLDATSPDDLVSLTGVWDRTSITSGDLMPAEDFRWRSVDGLEVQGWLYRARGEARGTVVHVHGGPTGHEEDELSPIDQYLLCRGFNILEPNYRGSTGFGLPFQELIKEDGWGGREQDDIRTGIEALIDAGIAQPGKVGITGTSYGGYSSWCAATRFPPEIVAASAPICGMTDLVVDYYTTRPDLRPYSEAMIGGTPEEVPERYRRGSPIHDAANVRGRLLIVQGMRDPNVTPENVRTMRDALDAAGIQYEVLAFEDEGHGIARPENRRVLFTRLAEFFGDAFGT